MGLFSNHVPNKQHHEPVALASQEEEAQRAAHLLDAQRQAAKLFDDIERNLVRPGVGEKAMSDEIKKLAEERGYTNKHWHKRVVRSGPNTLKPYGDEPPDRIVQEDDILFIDLGPVFADWEADFGRTFVLGNDPAKQRLRDSLEPAWKAGKAYFDANPDITGEELYGYVSNLAKEAGYDFGNEHSGHLIGDFPHERIPKDKISLYITKGNDAKMRSIGKNGKQRHWILEMHLVDRERQIGGFCEQLLSVG